MTKQLEKTFNMESLDKIKKAVKMLDDVDGQKNEKKEVKEEELETKVQEVKKQKSSVKNFLDEKFPDDDFDREMDEVSKTAGIKAEELYNIATQEVDARQIGEIANASARFLEIQLNAKSAKNQRKLDIYQMSLREREIKVREEKWEKEKNIDNAQIIDTDDDGFHNRNKILNDINNQ